MEPIVVGMAECVIADVPGQVLTTYALGSCIGLTVHDAHASLGGLLHFMLPDSAIDPVRGREEPCMFADTGIAVLLERMAARGAGGLAAHIAGGAQVIDGDDVLEIGKRNYLASRRILWKAGILLRGAAIGGTRCRSMHLEIGSGRVWVAEGGQPVDLSATGSGKGGVYGLPGLNCR
jgi:chemotaxis protein CheD